MFEYVGDVHRLPEYFPQITSVEELDGDTIRTTAHIEPPEGSPREVSGEAWFRVRTAGQSLEWGSQGPNNYSGELDVDPKDDTSSTVTVRITTDKEGDSIYDGMDKALSGIRDTIEADARQ